MPAYTVEISAVKNGKTVVRIFDVEADNIKLAGKLAHDRASAEEKLHYVVTRNIKERKHVEPPPAPAAPPVRYVRNDVRKPKDSV